MQILVLVNCSSIDLSALDCCRLICQVVHVVTFFAEFAEDDLEDEEDDEL